MATYLYSDPHFHHGAIIRHASRPFRTVEEMNRTLIERYQDRVGSCDLTIWLGDCCFGSTERLALILRSLPGYKVLVRGNHDKGPAAMARAGFDAVVERPVLEIAGHAVELSHYPFRDGVREGDARTFAFPVRTPGWVLAHGHTHSRRRRNGNMIHVGVDAWDFAPVSIAELEPLVEEVFAQ